jgi:hypothetical protein
MSEKALDIFKVLENASRKNIQFYGALDDHQQKALFPFVVQRWLSGTTSAQQVYLLNEVSNPYLFSLQKHKELIWFLMTICTSGKVQRHFWNKSPGKKTSSKPLSASAVAEYFQYSKKDANEALPLLSRDLVIGYAEELGWQHEELTKLKKEWKDDTKETDSSEGSKKRSKRGNAKANTDIFEE